MAAGVAGYTPGPSGRVVAPLVDRFGRVHNYLRISVTDRCNFRCSYCMPAEGQEWQPSSELLTDDEIVALAGLMAHMGVAKIRLTGGEPTVRPGLTGLIGRLADLPGVTGVYLTTNGHRLAEDAERYRRAGLAGVNVSVDSLRRDRFRQITGRDALERVLAGIDAAEAAGIPSIKTNTVVMRGINADELVDFVAYVADRPLTARFIEFMPFLSNGWDVSRVYPYADMLADLGTHCHLIPDQDEPHRVARTFSIDGHVGRIGFITSMTESFCSTCSRVRLTADGRLKACLFHGNETNLRDLLRSSVGMDGIEDAIRRGILAKLQEHAPMDLLAGVENRAMIGIGG